MPVIIPAFVPLYLHDRPALCASSAAHVLSLSQHSAVACIFWTAHNVHLRSLLSFQITNLNANASCYRQQESSRGGVQEGRGKDSRLRPKDGHGLQHSQVCTLGSRVRDTQSEPSLHDQHDTVVLCNNRAAALILVDTSYSTACPLHACKLETFRYPYLACCGQTC